ncbi:MAG: hypothetical protein HY659_14730 [Rhizobiales bacterium]|nr:hypothetical protein [Hyphomicrobiales bacterium]
MTTMTPSDELLKFCSGLHQDFMIYGPEPQDWIRGALGFVPTNRLPVFRDYLTQLLGGDYSDAQLQGLYRSTYTELRIWDDRGVRPFLAMVRDAIDKRLSE